MANLIQSLGYSLGKVHTGMISYLCELHREGNREPFESFLHSLGTSVPSEPIPHREWNSVDLAVLTCDKDGNKVPKILFEVKVDDYESGASQESYQTIRYASAWPACEAYFFVTLGKGEYYHPPRSDRFTWIRIRQFLEALQAINSPDKVIKDWIEEIKREIELQENVRNVRLAHMSRAQDYRSGTWNIYLLGQLAEMLKPKLANDAIDVDMTCYTYGHRPDTILNFGGKREDSLYMEINYSGKLNLKIDLADHKESRPEIVLQNIRKLEELEFVIAPTPHHGGKFGNSKRIASFDVGLTNNKEGNLEFQTSVEVTIQRLLSILSTFYGTKPKDP